MDAYQRCTLHGLLRCAMCSRTQTTSVASPKVDSAPPAELLDGPGDLTPLTAVEQDKVFEVAKDFGQTIADNLSKEFAPLMNPVVNAASKYATSQRAAEIAMRRVETLRLELQQAENAAADAIADRDMKKQVLQKLVTE